MTRINKECLFSQEDEILEFIFSQNYSEETIIELLIEFNKVLVNPENENLLHFLSSDLNQILSKFHIWNPDKDSYLVF